MRELAEFTQYRRRFKPFGKLKEQNIDDILAAFENKAKYLIENEIEKLKLNFQNARKCNERLEDLEEILADDEIDEEMQKGMREEFDEMQIAYPDIFPNNPPPHDIDFRLKLSIDNCIVNDQYNNGDAHESYVNPPRSIQSSDASRKSSNAESLPYRYVPESSPSMSETASSIASLPSISSRAPSELSFETSNADNRALSIYSEADHFSSVPSAPSRGTSSYGRARAPRRGQPRNTRGGGIHRPIDIPTVDSTVAKNTEQAVEPLMSVDEYIEKFQLEKNYPHKRLDLRPEKLFSLQKIHMEGKKLEKPSEEDSAWGSPGPFRSIHANEIKRKGSIGVDLGDINIPIDAILQTGSDGVGHSYLVLERGNSRVQAFDGNREPVSTQYENRDLLQHQYIESGSNDNNIRAPLVSHGQWFESCIVDHDNMYDNYFIGTSNDDRPGVIKCYDAAWDLIVNLKLNQPVYGICIIPGGSYSKVAKLVCITKFDAKSHYKYQLRSWTIMEKGSVKNKPSNLVIDFLTRLNEEQDCTKITHLASWSNQLYIVDAGRHTVYLTDLEGRSRKYVGQFKKSDEPGSFTDPKCLVVDAHGNFIVAEKYRLQAFDKYGQFLSVIDVSITGITGLQIDNLGRLFAASRTNHEIYCFQLMEKAADCYYNKTLSNGSQRFFRSGNEARPRRGRGFGRDRPRFKN